MNPGIHGSAMDLRMRSPSYSGGDHGKFLKSEQVPMKRKVSIEKTPQPEQYTSPFVMKANLPPTNHNKMIAPNYMQSNMNTLDLPQDEHAKDRRAMSSQKFYNMHNKDPSRGELAQIEKQSPKKVE